MTSSAPPDDWVDGSWTVDCVCGVTFDDGEEMVNCDECGVWVHTRCSRYVKSEKLFACDKCKSKNSRTNDSEETEVAQLLVELPTKTMRMESSFRLSDPPPRRPFRLWTDIPIEERVHVQGIPGGDPALFGGLSSVFTPELWKCTGCVPKKFNFQYREFPCWEENKEVGNGMIDAIIEQEYENPIDKGANVLFSLSKESMLGTSLATLVGMKGRGGEEGNGDRRASYKEVKKWDGEDLDARHSQKGTTREGSLVRPLVIHSSKRKKEDSGTSKDRSGKKRARALEKDADIKNRGVHSSKPVAAIPICDSKVTEFSEDRVPKFVKADSQNVVCGNLRNTKSQETVSGGNLVVENNLDKPKNNIAAKEGADLQVLARVESSSKSNAEASRIGDNNAGNVPLKEEGFSIAVDYLDDNGGGLSALAVIEPQKSNRVEDTEVAAAKVEDNQILEDSYGAKLQSSVQPNIKVKIEADDKISEVDLNAQSSPLVDVKVDGPENLAHYAGMSAESFSEKTKVLDAAVSILQSCEHKAQNFVKSSEAVTDCHTDKLAEKSGDQCQPNRELKGIEGCMVMTKTSSEAKQGLRQSEEQSTTGGMVLSPPPVPSQRKMLGYVGKSFSTSSTIVASKPFISDDGKPENTQTPNPIPKQRLTPSSSSSIKKDHVSKDVINDGKGHEMSQKIVKERPKSSVSSALKTLHSSRSSHNSVSKNTSSDSKDPVVYTSSKASSAQNAAVASGSGDSAGLLQTQSAAHGQSKITSSGLLQRGEKFNHLSGQPSTKVNHAPATHPPAPSNSLATLSDEELALLLHQELNSSPRVPRVPRVRQAGSLPQLASPTATSMLKRTSSFGGKDQSSVSRRKVKDVPKDGSRNSHELEDDAKKTDRVHSSPDQRRQDSTNTMNASTRKEADNASPEAVGSFKKNIPTGSALTANSGPSSSAEATGQNSSSIRYSPRNISDDDTGTVGGPAHRTLPGLINEIMSKGKRMTYEELCNAVLPHWHNLRKHNGERYAYSSHSQAVLDCLRNRTEWAQLVDRGPKTNASRKRRKVDAEPSSFESEDNKPSKGRTTKEAEGKGLESHREEFPKGKRKARKRRRLALQGRGIKDVRKRRKADSGSDDDAGLFSNSSEESMFSEDEIQGGGTTCPGGSEASASSDET